ncbi:endonuclease/exonuclease/phosphatase family protein [Lysinibacter sp. HNR]|uniref:endonuclease/exonuclease/phosphatase family protein n=1 Tax=Lysinibacter sp. HNR TaxID=3031408 RepID=UPI0024360177|nr:endonuclease/exonuclease/phosphatase family protein [Lysinibacter sp. HNR]WGD37312.1 endonuclease/exonuclease/phosphatase family protein [Lysinibacter sp. HNR]
MSLNPGAPARDAASGRAGGSWLIAILSLLTTALLVTQGAIPGVFGSEIATILPWLGLIIVALLLTSVFIRRGKVWIITLIPAVAWLMIFVPSLIPLSLTAPPAIESRSITVASHNVQSDGETAGESAQGLVDREVDLISLVELSGTDMDEVSEVLAKTHPYSYTAATVGLWSKYPLTNQSSLELGLAWARALNADVETPSGVVSVYVIHAASFRLGTHEGRDTMLAELGDFAPLDSSERIIMMGDFNATSRDPALASITSGLSEPNQSGLSFGFTWNNVFPWARIDHIFHRGLEPTENITFHLGKSDHLAVLTRFNIPE